MSEKERHLQVFLCHASSDKQIAEAIYEILVNDDIDAWLDKKNLIPGQEWQIEIPRAVKNADIVIVLLSSQSINKEGYIQKEIKIALDTAEEKPDGTIFIIPARLEDCDVPERLSKFHWVDLFTENGYDALMKSLRLRANSLGITPLVKQSSLNTRKRLKDFYRDKTIAIKETFGFAKMMEYVLALRTVREIEERLAIGQKAWKIPDSVETIQLLTEIAESASQTITELISFDFFMNLWRSAHGDVFYKAMFSRNMRVEQIIVVNNNIARPNIDNLDTADLLSNYVHSVEDFGRIYIAIHEEINIESDPEFSHIVIFDDKFAVWSETDKDTVAVEYASRNTGDIERLSKYYQLRKLYSRKPENLPFYQTNTSNQNNSVNSNTASQS